MSLGAFAEISGTSVSTLKRWEAGQVSPSEAIREIVLERIQSESKLQFENWRCHPGWWLRVCRIRRGLSIRDAGSMSGTSSSAWQRYETGLSPVGKAQAIRIAATLGPGFEGCHFPKVTSFQEAQLQYSRLKESNPNAASAWCIGGILLLETQRSGYPEVQWRKLIFDAHVALGEIVLRLGDHDLSAISCLAALRIADENCFENIPKAEVKARSVWRGMPFIKQPIAAATRLNWFDRQVKQLSRERQLEMGNIRAMFLDWSVDEKAAQEALLGFPLDAKTGEPQEFIKLCSGWIHARHGKTSLALDIAGPGLNHENFQLAFIANKISLEARFKNKEMDLARKHLEALERINFEHAIWSQDITVRSRYIRS